MYKRQFLWSQEKLKDQRRITKSYLDFCTRAKIFPYTELPIDIAAPAALAPGGDVGIAPIVGPSADGSLVAPAPGSAEDSPVAPAPGLLTAIAAKPSDASRTIIELCCETDSVLGHKKYVKDGCRVVRITKEDNLASKVGQSKALSAINGPNTMLHIALPCTGGCPWMTVLMSKPGGKKQQRAHYNEMRRLWRAMLPIAAAVHAAGGTINFEWPRTCKYWKLPFVQAFLVKYKLSPAHFDGCAFNLKSIVKENLFIKKPWTFATNNPAVHMHFDKCYCNKSHQHTPCEGKDTGQRGDIRTRWLVLSISPSGRFVMAIFNGKDFAQSPQQFWLR